MRVRSGLGPVFRIEKPKGPSYKRGMLNKKKGPCQEHSRLELRIYVPIYFLQKKTQFRF